MTDWKFKSGSLVATLGAHDKLQEFGNSGRFNEAYLIDRHMRGDWGDVDEHDQQMNEEALRLGNRLLSVYNLPDGGKVFVITEADRSATTLMLPSEY